MEKDSVWFKANFTGYEGLVEYVISKLLLFLSLDESEFVLYNTEKFSIRNKDI